MTQPTCARNVLLCGLGVLLVLLTAGCQSSPGYPEVHLRELEPVHVKPGTAVGEPPLRIAIASVLSPRGTIESYNRLLTYVGEQMGRRVELIQRQTYAETNELIARANVDLAFVCSGAYVEGRRDKSMELLVAPQVNGDTVYYSYIIVPAGSSAQSLQDLRGKAFAFTDPLSNSGRLAAIYQLWQMGERPESFFQRVIYTYSHDNSIKAVADKVVDGASVDSLVYDFLVQRGQGVPDKVRVIQQSAPFGIPPVVIPASLDPALKTQLRDVLLNMHKDQNGLAALAEIGVDRFVVVDESAYDSIRQMAEIVGRP